MDRENPSFPTAESFTDCTGARREFAITLLDHPGGYFVRALEVRPAGDEGGYAFAAHASDNPYLALARLRQKIQRGLATRYLAEEQGRATLSHDRLRGHIGFGGVVVDGQFLDFEDFCGLLQTYEGYQFSLKLADPYDEI